MPSAIPRVHQTSLGQRSRWPSLAGVELERGEVLPLCRLRYSGAASLWGFAVYWPAATGTTTRPCQADCRSGPRGGLDCVCGLYLDDPSAWEEYLPPAGS